MRARSVPDAHGVLRGKLLMLRACHGALENGLAFTNAPFNFDTGDAFVLNQFEKGDEFGRAETEDCSDVIVVADPTSFHALPWTPATRWMNRRGR